MSEKREQVRRGLFKGNGDAGLRVRRAQRPPPRVQRLGGKVEDAFVQPLMGAQIEQRERGGAVGTIERDEQIITGD